MEAVRKALVADKHTLLLYTSPSNMGYKGLALYEPTNTPPRSFLGEFYLKLNIKIDNSTLFSTQSCFISFDENAYLNLDAEPFIFKETQQPPKKNGGGLVIDYEPSANANSSHVQSYCRKIIEQSARYVFDAPKGTGGDILKGAAYKCGLYAAYGLSKADAAVALWQAFDKRQTGHDKKEFFRLFDFCFEAGKMEAQTNPPAPIKDRPPVQQK
jgi:hypothetical protein